MLVSCRRRSGDVTLTYWIIMSATQTSQSFDLRRSKNLSTIMDQSYLLATRNLNAQELASHSLVREKKCVRISQKTGRSSDEVLEQHWIALITDRVRNEQDSQRRWFLSRAPNYCRDALLRDKRLVIL